MYDKQNFGPANSNSKLYVTKTVVSQYHWCDSSARRVPTNKENSSHYTVMTFKQTDVIGFTSIYKYMNIE